MRRKIRFTFEIELDDAIPLVGIELATTAALVAAENSIERTLGTGAPAGRCRVTLISNEFKKGRL